MDEMRQKLARMEAELPAIIAERDQAARYLESATFDKAHREELAATVRQDDELIQMILDFRVMMAQEEARQGAWKQMLTGVGIALLGGLVTGGSYLLAPMISGGTYILAWGAIVFGLVRAALGAFRFFALSRSTEQ